MSGPFQPGPATPAQLERLRELARTPGMPDEAVAFVEQRIEAGLDVNAAYRMIQKLGRRAYDVSHPAPESPASPPPRRRRKARPAEAPTSDETALL